MKIDKILFSCDLNPNYVGFWNSISSHINKFLNIECQLLCLGDPAGKGFSDKHGEIKVVPLLKDYPPILQALWAKFWYTSLEPETTWMVGDLDLYPMQRKHFIDDIILCGDDEYLHLNYAAYGRPWNDYEKIEPGIAGYYHVAKGKKLTEVLEFRDTFEDDVKHIYSAQKYGIKFFPETAGGNPFAKNVNPDTFGWFCAEEHYCSDILRRKPDTIKNHSTYGADKRIDRSHGCSYNLDLLVNHHYVDMHSLRPYEKFAPQIEKLLALCRHEK